MFKIHVFVKKVFVLWAQGRERGGARGTKREKEEEARRKKQERRKGERKKKKGERKKEEGSKESRVNPYTP